MKTPRAIATGLLVAIVAFALLVVVPDQLLQLSGSRSTLVFYATVEFVVALVLLLWAMRRLQQRKLL
jgi:protein-S-isoprenylcysteine O-methyltransferase Ste14